jgi:diketogulonate reductase-like aldo/keto reductase
MIERSIPSSGDRLPVIGLGTWQTFDVSSGDPARARLGSVLQVLAHAGRSVMDSSPMYGTSEAVVGEMIEEMGLQDRFFIATKVWTEGRKAGIRQMEESMQRLRVDRIDLMQVHNLIDARTHLRTLQEWKQAGRVRYTGITHYSAAHHDALCRVARANNVDFIQVNYSVAEREAERRVLPFAREHGMAVIVNRPFTEGKLLRRVEGRALPEWAGELDCTSWAQLLLKFVVSHPAVTSVIPATSNVSHCRENLKAGTEPLPDEAMRERIVAAALAA